MAAELRSPIPTRIVLIGMMGAGKSTVGPVLAARLGWSFEDLDLLIARNAKRSIPQIFAEQGESEFRRLEAAEGARVLVRTQLVVGTGGGWAANTERPKELPAGTMLVWLRVSPDEALKRVMGDPGSERPLLHSSRPEETLRELLDRREPFYTAADISIWTDGRSAADVAAEIESYLRRRIATPAKSRSSGANAEQ